MGKEDVTRARDINEAILLGLPVVMSQLNKDLRHSQSNVAGLCLTGPPGVGKTQAFQSEMKKLGYKVYTLPCGTVDEVLTFQGLPEVVNKNNEYGAAEVKTKVLAEEMSKLTGRKIDEDDEMLITVGSQKKREGKGLTTSWAPPEWIQLLKNLKPSDKCVVIFDDFHFIKGASIMELLTNNREVNGHVLGNRNNIALVFIGNGLEDSAGAQEMLAPVLDRMVSISVEGVNADKWLAWGESEGDLHELVLAYIDTNKEELFQRGVGIEDPTDRRPGPRGWANFSDQLKLADKLDDVELIRKTLPGATPEQIEAHLEAGKRSKELFFSDLGRMLSGIVGREAANKFNAWHRTYKKYPFEDYLKDINREIDIEPDQLANVALNFSFRFANVLIELKKFLVKNAAKDLADYYDKPENRKALEADSTAVLVDGKASSAQKRAESVNGIIELVRSGEDILSNLKDAEKQLLLVLMTVNDSKKEAKTGAFEQAIENFGVRLSPIQALDETKQIENFINGLEDRYQSGEKLSFDEEYKKLMKDISLVLTRYRDVELPENLQRISNSRTLDDFVKKLVSLALRFSQKIACLDGAQRQRAFSTFFSRTHALYKCKDQRLFGKAQSINAQDTSESHIIIHKIVGNFIGSLYENDLRKYSTIHSAADKIHSALGDSSSEESAGEDAPKRRGRRPKS